MKNPALGEGSLETPGFWQEGVFDVFIQKTLELASIPSRVSLFPFHNERWVSPDPETQGFIDSERRLDIDQLNQEAMFIESF